MLKLKPQWDGVWRWDLWKVIRSRVKPLRRAKNTRIIPLLLHEKAVRRLSGLGLSRLLDSPASRIWSLQATQFVGFRYSSPNGQKQRDSRKHYL